MTAGQELRGLVQAGLVEQSGIGRWTYYTLKVQEEPPKEEERTDEEKILVHIQEHGSINNAECRELLGVDDTRAYYLLKKLCGKGHLKPQKKGKGRRYVVP
jgi:predicted HTH transcriptional regulator